MNNDERSAAMTYQMVGRQYYVEFPTMYFLSALRERSGAEFIVKKSPDLRKGSAHTVNVTIELLRDEILYGVVAGEERKHSGSY